MSKLQLLAEELVSQAPDGYRAEVRTSTRTDSYVVRVRRENPPAWANVVVARQHLNRHTPDRVARWALKVGLGLLGEGS